MLFLDPDRPMATCRAESCQGCMVSETLHCHFRPVDYIHFLFISLPAFLVGGAGIYYVSGWWLALWLLMIIGFFGLLEIRVLCSHCPHYAEPGRSLKCWANYGAPKIWTFRPGPMSAMEKVVQLGGFIIIWGYPLVFLIMDWQWLLLIVYLMTAIGFFMTLKLFLCSQCINFACPFNGVDEKVRREFFKRNPEVGRAWGAQIDN